MHLPVLLGTGLQDDRGNATLVAGTGTCHASVVGAPGLHVSPPFSRIIYPSPSRSVIRMVKESFAHLHESEPPVLAPEHRHHSIVWNLGEQHLHHGLSRREA